jgi:Spy/CpxP family protein refolding chaperone
VTKLVVIFGFLLAFVAGLIVGVNRPQPVASISSAPVGGPQSRPSRESELDTLLNLRPEQKAELKKIWSEMADRGRKQHEDQRRDLRRQRDEKVQALLTPEQKSSFEQIHKDYDDQNRALESEMRANFQKAVEATKALLDPDQRAKYEEWLSKRQWDRGPRGGGGPGGPGGGEHRGTGGPGGPGGPNRFDRDATRRPDAGATSKASDQP